MAYSLENMPQSGTDQDERLRELAEEVVGIVTESDSVRAKELLGLFVSELFSLVSEQSRREVLRQKQAEGIAAARSRGVRFGRRAKPLPENFGEVCRSWKNKELTLGEAADACGMPQSTFYNVAMRQEQA